MYHVSQSLNHSHLHLFVVRVLASEGRHRRHCKALPAYTAFTLSSHTRLLHAGNLLFLHRVWAGAFAHWGPGLDYWSVPFFLSGRGVKGDIYDEFIVSYTYVLRNDGDVNFLGWSLKCPHLASATVTRLPARRRRVCHFASEMEKWNLKLQLSINISADLCLGTLPRFVTVTHSTSLLRVPKSWMAIC